MSEQAASDEADAAEEAALVFAIKPPDYRRTAVLAFGVAALLLVAEVVAYLWWDRLASPVVPLGLIAFGIYSSVQARRRRTRTMLRIDREGITSEDGSYDRTWSGVSLIWVGSPSGLRLRWVAQPSLSLFTTAGLDFAERAGTQPKPVVSVPVGGLLTVPALCARLRRLTTAEVVDGTQTSRRAAAAALAERTL